MKTKTLLKQAARCKSNADCNALLNTMKGEFAEKGPFQNLYYANAEVCLEDGDPFVRFELKKAISGDYVISIVPEIRNKKLFVVVRLDHMLDGLGMGSKNWEMVDEDVVESDPDRTVANLCKRAKELAVGVHQRLIESVGVSRVLAEIAARKSF